jgi:hypothetical protein
VCCCHLTTQDCATWLPALVEIDLEVELANGDKWSWEEHRNVFRYEIVDEDNCAELCYQIGIAEGGNHWAE